MPATPAPRHMFFNFRQMKITEHMLSVLFLAAATILVLALPGCMSEPVGPGAGQIGEQYFNAIKAGDFQAAAELYAPDVSRAAVVDELMAQNQRLGDLESFRMTDLVSYTANGGLRFTLRFMTRYSKGHATEGLLLFQSSSDNSVRIVEHTVQ